VLEWQPSPINHCAYVVQKNITCTTQDGMATYVTAEYTTKCIWGQKCPVVMYRTFYKPKYKVGYKTITELEWRCCPGYSGENCYDGPTSLPDMIPPLDHKPVPGGANLEPGRQGWNINPFIFSNPDLLFPFLPLPYVGVSGERLDRMEVDLRRLTQGLDILNGVVASLEDRLRLSLREDTTKMLGSLLSSAPRLSDSSVGFGVIPDGTPDGLKGGEGFPGFGDLAGRVTEVKDELRAKGHMLEEIQVGGMVLGHDWQLKRMLEAATGRPIPGSGSPSIMELLDAKLAGVRAEILDGFERRLSGLENHCEERIGEVQRQCHNEHMNGQEQIQQSLDGRETGLREELGTLQAQIQGLTLTESCCGQVNSLSQRVLMLEESVTGLTESQRQLQAALTDQTIHIETLIEARLENMDARLNATESGEVGVARVPWDLDGFKTLEDKLKTLENRVFVAVEELRNATAPALLEGQVVPALETEIESVRRRVEGDLDGIQKQLTDLELLCTSSCSPATTPEGGTGTGLAEEECEEVEKKVSGRLDSHADQLDHLNTTLQTLLNRIAQEDEEGSVQGEITLLKINVNSVNRTLKGLRDSVSLFTKGVGQVNATWTHRENQLATEVQGITQLVGRQASLLGAGERRLAQLKGELVGLRRRLAGELQGCWSTALGVQREVKEVDSRVSQVEGQCGSLGELADHLERIRAELERHSDSYLSQVNGTLASHSTQIAELKGEIKDCVGKGSANHRGDQ
uniref:EMI domain-containing protein n=1 Tax=Oncorhynchus tshawytscha TaxID=74940 RepID=A0A8C8F7P6_ONCTS